jgi:hypothetical protein
VVTGKTDAQNKKYCGLPLPRRAAINNHASIKYFYTYPVPMMMCLRLDRVMMLDEGFWMEDHPPTTALQQPVFMREKTSSSTETPIQSAWRHIHPQILFYLVFAKWSKLPPYRGDTHLFDNSHQSVLTDDT